MNQIDLIVLPDPDDPYAAQILVEGMVGDRHYRFLLDTGAGRSTVVYDDYTATLPRVGRSESGGLFAGKTEDLITIPSLRLGPITRSDLVVNRLPQAAAHRSGLIGMDVLSASTWHFQIQQNRVLIDSPFESASESLHELQLDHKLHPYVNLRLQEDQAQAVWDTGAGVTVVDLGFIEQHPENFEQVGQSTGTDSTGTSRETPIFLMTGAQLGGADFPPHPVAGVDLSHVNASIELPMDMILGYTTLRLADWYFDFPGRKWALLGRHTVAH